MGANTPSEKSTEQWLEEAIIRVQSASTSNQILHFSQVFTGDPNGFLAVNATFVVCDDELAPDLHKRLDETVEKFFKEHNIVMDPKHPSNNPWN